MEECRQYGKLRISELLIVVSVVLTSVLIGIIILLDSERPSYYEWLPILPISFGIINLFTYRIYKNIMHNLPYILVIGMYMMRNVITPLLMRCGDYAGIMKMLNNSNTYMAIMLMIYETIMVFVLLLLFSQKERNINFELEQMTSYLQRKPSNLFWFMLCVITVVCIISYMKVPEIATNKVSIMQLNEMSGIVSKSKLFSDKTYGHIFYTLFHFCFNFMRIFIGVTLIVKIRKVIGDNWLGIINCVLIIASNLLFITNETGYIFIVIFILFVIIYQLFPKSSKILMVIFTLGFIVTVSLIYIVKSQVISGKKDAYWVSNSMMLQAYLPGVCNTASIFNIEDENKLNILWGDIYSTIPFKNTILPLQDVKGIIDIYSFDNRQYYQIVPCIGQGYYYLGFVFSPVLSVLIILCGIKAYIKFFKASNIWEGSPYLLLCVFSCITPVMYNATIWGTRFCETIVPMLLLSKYFKLKRFAQERVSQRKRNTYDYERTEVMGYEDK